MEGMRRKLKKALLYLLIFLFIFFLLPAFLTKNSIKSNLETSAEDQGQFPKESLEDVEQNNSEAVTENKYDYNQYAKIKLLHKKTEEIEEVNLDEYLCNVVSAEMPADYEKEALKAQAIVARTYTIFKAQNPKHENSDICDDSTCCQAWISKEDRLARWEESKRESNWNKIQEAVKETQGKIITYNNEPINAFFHSNSGGTTEVPVNVWGGRNYPYLQVVQTTGEEGYNQYSSEVELTNEELLNKLRGKYSDIQIDFNNKDDIKILEYTDSNRVKTIKFGNHEFAGVEARSILGLKSTNFEIVKEDEKIKFSVKGYGHGVGMSQTGADAMAKEGKNCEEIIKHFYVGVSIDNI